MNQTARAKRGGGSAHSGGRRGRCWRADSPISRCEPKNADAPSKLKTSTKIAARGQEEGKVGLRTWVCEEPCSSLASSVCSSIGFSSEAISCSPQASTEGHYWI